MSVFVFIADDDLHLRAALVEMVASQPDLEVVGEASDAAAAIEAAGAVTPDVVILDLNMPGGGITAVHEIRRRAPKTRVIAFSGLSERGWVEDLKRAGVADYVVKGSPFSVLMKAVRRGALTAESLTPPAPPPSKPGIALSAYKALFELVPGLYLVLDPELRIVAASDAYLRATMTRREDILGSHVFEVFPDNPQDSHATGVRNLSASLDRVKRTLKPDTMAIQKYDIRRPDSAGGGFELRYWSPVNTPVLSPNGRLAYIIHRVEDVTEFVLLKERESIQEEEAHALRKRSERMEAEVFGRAQELQELNRQLEVASNAKSEFLSRMSHELRTPLTQVMGFAELL